MSSLTVPRYTRLKITVGFECLNTQTGVQRAGGFTGVWVAVETVCFAIGPAIFLATIALGGFVSSSDGGAAQPAGAIAAILVGFGVSPTLLVAASLPLIRRVAVGYMSGR